MGRRQKTEERTGPRWVSTSTNDRRDDKRVDATYQYILNILNILNLLNAANFPSSRVLDLIAPLLPLPLPTVQPIVQCVGRRSSVKSSHSKFRNNIRPSPRSLRPNALGKLSLLHKQTRKKPDGRSMNGEEKALALLSTRPGGDPIRPDPRGEIRNTLQLLKHT